MKTLLAAAGLGLAALAWAAPAAAENTGPARRDTTDRLEAELDARARDLGARLLEPETAWSTWLWGAVDPPKPGGQGRQGGQGRERDARPLDFTLDGPVVRDMLERWLPRP
jgi:hypothetical protein